MASVIRGSGQSTLGGNLDVEGVLTYEDVTSVDSVGIITARSGVKVPDNQKVFLGTGDDLEISHDGTDSIIDNNTGDLYVQTTGSGDDIIIRAADDVIIQTQGSEGAVIARGDGTVELYHNNSKKLETTSTGVSITGDLANASLTNAEVAAISASISDTAVDVFVYDTSKDSDGGAWRKRTQHTSWYNETLGTATRGSRREFPAVAVIVAEEDKVTIYDGDDPDMPMWMVFNSTANRSFIGYQTNPSTDSVKALNASLVVGSSGELNEINFLRDNSFRLGSTASWYTANNISQRNVDFTSFNDTGLRSVSNGDYYVAMTVLPNAPIDDTTGLPIPTIAVATDGGVSIIKDDGRVTTQNHQESSNKVSKFIDIQPTGVIRYGNRSYGSTPPGNFYVYSNSDFESRSTRPDRLYTYIGQSLSNYEYELVGQSNGYTTPFCSIVGINHEEFVVGTGYYPSEGQADNGIYKVIESDGSGDIIPTVANITNTYNTGWMHGDIKGAFLSDISTTNLVATDLDIVTNGSFAADSDWTKGTGWTISGGTATHTGSGGDFNQQIAVVAGRRYLMSVTVDLTGDTSVSNTSIGLRTLANDGYYVSKTSWTANAVNTAELYWTSTVTGNILARCFSEDDVSLDNWVVQDVTGGNGDRSVSNNGLRVSGTITKSPVAGSGATAAELVGYSGFSASDYLKNKSSYNFGSSTTSVLCIIGWFKNTAVSQYQYIGSVHNSSVSAGAIGLALNITTGYPYVYDGNTASISSTAYNDGEWHCAVGIIAGGLRKIYVDGNEILSTTLTYYPDMSSVDTLAVGHYCDQDNVQYSSLGSLSLVRFSNTIPSPEQIKKMYEDEKVLFQENAKATLYGSSDAVTALAYDDDEETLYVGTSSGRSDFRGLRRINNTTTAVTTAISASNGLVAEQ